MTITKYPASLQAKIDYSIALLRKAEKLALQYDKEDGFYLAFSGGKDSQCLYHIAQMAGVKFKAHMNLTSVDPPEVIRFVKRNYPDVELIKPKMSIYDMALKKHFLPTKKNRWCCDEFKEASGAGKVTLIEIRKAESVSRNKRQEVSTEIKGERRERTFDQFSEHEEQMVTCVGGKDKILISPIIYWSDKDVWQFLNKSGIEHCELYDQGHHRIGCILCPMSNTRQKNKDAIKYPHVKRNWIKTIQQLIGKGYIKYNAKDAEFFYRWWTSGKSFKQFYADEVLQGKLEF